MENIIEFIMQNYIWIIGGVIVILLAVIGYYADKTNFGQGHNKIKNGEPKEELIDLSNVRLSNLVEGKENNEPNVNNIETQMVDTQNQIVAENNDLRTTEINQSNPEEDTQQQPTIDLDLNINKEINYNEESSDIEEKKSDFEEFNKEFDEILPKKSIMEEALLDEIENLSLDKTQKISSSEILGVDDLDLPKIKSMEKADEDIWKF